MPLFTVVCPTWNRGSELRPTIESVVAQTQSDFELIIASDGSTDDTDRVARQLAHQDSRIRFLRTRRYGFQAGPVNEALARARGELIAYIDHDDVWAPHHLSVLAGLLERADLAATRARKVDNTGHEVSVAHPLTLLWHPEVQVLNPLFENSCAGHRKWLTDRISGWTESRVGLEDWDLWVRMADAGAEVATTLRTTVDLLADPGSRQHSLPLHYYHRLAAFPDARSARTAIRRLVDVRRYPEARQACLDDLRTWYQRLITRDELVFPDGWPQTGIVGDAVIESHLDEAGVRWQTPVIEETEHESVVGIPIATMTPEHAARYGRLFAAIMPRQREFFNDTLGGREITA